MSVKKELELVIDASNIKLGGGLTHLKEFISYSDPFKYGFKNVILWASDDTLHEISDRTWLKKKSHEYLNKGYFYRAIWQQYILKSTLGSSSVLYIPGGGYLSFSGKVITMCRNLLPIDKKEMNRFWPSMKWVRYRFLRFLHFQAYTKADGVIFLNKYSHNVLPSRVKNKIKNFRVIPHGLNNSFKKNRKVNYQLNDSIELLYVSRINLYKHQWNVAKAVYELNRVGYNINLNLVGGMNGPGKDRLEEIIEKNKSEFPEAVKLHNVIPYEELPKWYKNSDIFVFASSCETFGNILLEAMGAGLPIACSNSSSMHELLEDAGVYFDPEDIDSLTSALKRLIDEDIFRKQLGKKSALLSDKYSWEGTTHKTFNYLLEVANS